MFGLFKENKEKNKDEVKDKVDVKKTKVNNYEDKDDEIEIRVCRNQDTGRSYYNISIPKSSIVTHTNDTIIFKNYEYDYSHYSYHITRWGLNEYSYVSVLKSIENKENFITYKNTYIITYNYRNTYGYNGKYEWYWYFVDKKIINKEIESEKTPLEIFKEKGGKYKLIETEDELNNYLSSTLDCDTWCRMKLYNKMKELGLGDGFINNFADLIGDDLNKYHAMIDLANEVSDKDTLMYLYTYKFSEKKQEKG